MPASADQGGREAKRRKKDSDEDEVCNSRYDLDTGANPNIALRFTPTSSIAVTRGLADLIDNAYDAASGAENVQIHVVADGTEVDVSHGDPEGFSSAKVITVTITNDCGVRHDGTSKQLEFRHFRRKMDVDTMDDRTRTGKFGVGLKDSVAFFRWFDIAYEAWSGINHLRSPTPTTARCMSFDRSSTKNITMWCSG
eukprot:m.121082 g.121082  ORF g.121082 m.121082 type:complete len:196 (-) comp13373_c0_seq1:54-641(-)